MNTKTQQQHPDHKKHISHINRIKGQIEGVSKMIGVSRYFDAIKCCTLFYSLN